MSSTATIRKISSVTFYDPEQARKARQAKEQAKLEQPAWMDYPIYFGKELPKQAG